MSYLKGVAWRLVLGMALALIGCSSDGDEGSNECVRPRVNSCGTDLPAPFVPDSACSNEGFACTIQWEEPCNTQNYFEAFNCCCGFWIRSGPYNSGTRAFTCEQLAAQTNPQPETSCYAAGGAAP